MITADRDQMYLLPPSVRDLGFRVIAGNRQPDHATIARFRRDNEKPLALLFTQILRLCRKAGLIRVGVVALDGTKIKANAALDANRTHDSIEAEVGKMLQEAKANVTDPESRIMKTRSGYVQGYNAQAAVTEDQIIIAAELTDEANDVQQLHPMLTASCDNLKDVGITQRMGNVLADAGYWSEANAKRRRGRPSTELWIATSKDWKQRKRLRELPPPRGRIPNSMSARDLMERKLLTKRGRAL